VIDFSTRSRFASAPNRLTLALAEARLQGRALLDLTESNPTRVGLGLSAAELLPLLPDPRVANYEPEPLGLRSAREVVAHELRQRGHAIDAEHVLLTASTSEAYGLLFKLLCEPGDSVLVPAPSYPLFDVLAQLEQVRLVPYRLAYDGEWHLDASALSAAREPRTRAILCVHPNNPTGSFLKRGELAALSALGLPIVSDEVFSEYALRSDPQRADSALEASDRTLIFRLAGLSKSAALPQLKLAWTAIAGPKAQVDEARARLEHMADAYLSPNAVTQHALGRLLEASVGVRAEILARVRENLRALHAALADSAASVLDVEGGWYAVVRLPALHDDEAWALRLLSEDDLIVQPGYYYELTSGSHVVLSLLAEPEVWANATARLVARVHAECA
jgi:alanine-synthesizing transaminase